MPRKPYKHKLLLDEGLYPRQVLQRTNSRHHVIHIRHDLKKGGAKDSKVYEIATRLKRIIVTYNIDDFRHLAGKSKDTGVIGVTQGLTPEQLDKQLNALLSKSSEKSLYGKYTSLSQNK